MQRQDFGWQVGADRWCEGQQGNGLFGVDGGECVGLYVVALHDQAGILKLMGGADAYNAKLDQHFTGGHNVHSNEPSHHYGYLYDFSGQPWKTQAKVREIAAAEYAGLPVGLDGDDDCGQMSAWLFVYRDGFLSGESG